MTEATRTPQQVARYDQLHAAVSVSLDELIGAYQASLAAGEPRDLMVVGQGVWLRENFDRDALAEHLTLAIQRLAEAHHG